MNPQEKEFIRQLESSIVELDKFTKTPGYQMMMQAFEAAYRESYEKMISAPTDRQGALQTGAYHVLTNVLTWAEREIAIRQSQLAQIQSTPHR